MAASKQYSDELQRALARPDADRLVEQLDAYSDHLATGENDRSDQHAEDFGEVLESDQNPDKALAYLALALSRSDDASFLGFLGSGPLENLLIDPSADVLERIVAEARKSARFRWLLSNPFKVAIAERSWEAIEKFRITGPHEEPSYEALPPRRGRR